MLERPKNINLLAKQIFADNKAKGFHDEEYSNEHYLQLVICELCEAVEADRKGKISNLFSFDTLHSNKPEYAFPLSFTKCFDECIKGGTGEELADAVIRLLDLAGLRGIVITDVDISAFRENFNSSETYSFCENIFSIVSYLIGISIYDGLTEVIPIIISCIELVCEKYNIDLWRIVELKLEYNKLRPYKHGKKY